MPADITIECSETGGVSHTDPLVQAFLAGVSASDIVDPSPGITNDADGFCELGVNLVTFTATDASGNSSEGVANITVVDTTAPHVRAALVRIGRDRHHDDDDGGWYRARFRCADTCDANPTLTGVIKTPSLEGLRVKLKTKRWVKVKFDLKHHRVKIEGN